MISVNYQPLFTIELLHNYFASGACTDFIITPTARTVNVLNGYKIKTKQYGHKLFTAIQSDPSIPAGQPPKPFIIPGADMQLTFFLQLNNPLFFNYTALPFSNPANNIYYFTNKSNNIHNGKNLLSDDVFVTENAALTWLPSRSTYQLPPHTPAVDIEVSKFDNPPDHFTLVLSKHINLGTDASSFTLDLAALPPGKYKLKVNADEQIIYLNDELNSAQTFAVIDIYNDGTIQNNYQLLDASRQLNAPLFTVQFLSRSTIWKYVLLSDATNKLDPDFTYVDVGITEETGTYIFHKTDIATIYSATPIPLSETPLSLTLTIDTDHPLHSWSYSKIAGATPQRLSICQPGPGPEVFPCSEIFLNYYHIKPKT